MLSSDAYISFDDCVTTHPEDLPLNGIVFAHFDILFLYLFLLFLHFSSLIDFLADLQCFLYLFMLPWLLGQSRLVIFFDSESPVLLLLEQLFMLNLHVRDWEWIVRVFFLFLEVTVALFVVSLWLVSEFSTYGKFHVWGVADKGHVVELRAFKFLRNHGASGGRPYPDYGWGLDLFELVVLFVWFFGDKRTVES